MEKKSATKPIRTESMPKSISATRYFSHEKSHLIYNFTISEHAFIRLQTLNLIWKMGKINNKEKTK